MRHLSTRTLIPIFAGCVMVAYSVGLEFTGPVAAQETKYQDNQAGNSASLQSQPDAQSQATDASGMNPNASQNQAPRQPEGFPISAEEQAWVDSVLNYWEQTSDSVKALEADFQRWHYMPQALNYRDPQTNKVAARMICRGTIKYGKPDRGRMDTNEFWHFNPPATEGADPEYQLNEDPEARQLERERWICTGKAIYEFDFANKRLNEMRLPPELQGEGLSNSPLPFVFGAKAADLKERYWIRPAQLSDIPDDYYAIEAFPKRPGDANTYSKVQIVLSREPFLPVRVHLYSSNYDNNGENTVIEFSNHRINNPLQLGQQWFSKVFSPPQKPVNFEWGFRGEVGGESDAAARRGPGNQSAALPADKR